MIMSSIAKTRGYRVGVVVFPFRVIRNSTKRKALARIPNSAIQELVKTKMNLPRVYASYWSEEIIIVIIWLLMSPPHIIVHNPCKLLARNFHCSLKTWYVWKFLSLKIMNALARKLFRLRKFDYCLRLWPSRVNGILFFGNRFKVFSLMLQQLCRANQPGKKAILKTKGP